LFRKIVENSGTKKTKGEKMQSQNETEMEILLRPYGNGPWRENRESCGREEMF